MGCGRNFDGSIEQLRESLLKISKLEKKGKRTKIYCGHEYTLKNLDFCIDLHKKCNYLGNKETFNELKDYQSKIVNLRSRNEPSIPSLLIDELKFNPFLQRYNPKIMFHLIRSLKNEF